MKFDGKGTLGGWVEGEGREIYLRFWQLQALKRDLRRTDSAYLEFISLMGAAIEGNQLLAVDCTISFRMCGIPLPEVPQWKHNSKSIYVRNQTRWNSSTRARTPTYRPVGNQRQRRSPNTHVCDRQDGKSAFSAAAKIRSF